MFTENQHTNRRIYQCKKEIREDFEMFSKIIKEQDLKMFQFLKCSLKISSLANLI